MKFIKNKLFLILPLLILSAISAGAQTEVLTNADVAAMSQAKLGGEIIIAKIKNSDTKFETTARALIELKNASVEDKVIAVMLEAANRTEKLETRQIETTKTGSTELSEAAPNPTRKVDYKTPAQILREAKTVFFKKNSIYPSLKEVESSLLNRQRSAKWSKFGLTITEYEADADIIVEIGNEFLTHYNFRVTDVKTGRVVAASGVTSLGGALAGNVADKLIKRLNEVSSEK